ncbi:hypothetical protein IB292_02010 [Vibrio parahaemolyticus]|uniref:Uncharacterized protein n=1 Tax=Vibrio parahaemolyticus TaxID=670 RepID=A0A9Q3YHQ8_VIBPH|nr:hypothetical protein [Vibrio parahaemolyticus]MCC3803802.1 hypothetical protein [Vibrio parahaemolyticus]
MATEDFSKNTDHNKEITLPFNEQITTKAWLLSDRSLGERRGFSKYDMFKSPYNEPIRNRLFIMRPLFYERWNELLGVKTRSILGTLRMPFNLMALYN